MQYDYESALTHAANLLLDLRRIIDADENPPREERHAAVLSDALKVLYCLVWNEIDDECNEEENTFVLNLGHTLDALDRVAMSSKMRLDEAAMLIPLGFKIRPKRIW